MRSLYKNHFILLYLFSFFIFISCSKDSDESTPQETETTVTTANFSITMDENPVNGQAIGTVSGTTSEGSVTFSITEQTPSGALYIDSTTGELKVADEMLFDFESNPTITGTVKVANGAVSQNAVVTITLNDLVEENVFDGDVILRSQLEVNDFGANNYTRINGFLLVGKLENEGYSDITDLTPLLSLEHIQEYLYIQYNQALTTTHGLDNVLFLGNYFALLHNPSIENLVGLNNIENIGGFLAIDDNPVLVNVDGLSNITNIGEHFFIGNNVMLTNLDWLNNLLSVGSHFYINNNAQLRNIEGLSSLTQLSGNLEISGNDALTNLSGFQNLAGTILSLTIMGNNSLESTNGLEGITINGSIDITNNPLLEDLNSLLNTSSINGSLTIRNNDSLVNLNGLNNLLTVIFSVEIYHNSNLIDFCDLQNLFINGNNPSYTAYSNAYNPTKQDIIDGNCSL